MKPWIKKVAVAAFYVVVALVFWGAFMSDVERHRNCLWAAENNIEAYRRFCK